MNIKINIDPKTSQLLFPSELKELLIELHRKFNRGRIELLAERDRRQKKYDQGAAPGYITDHPFASELTWKVAPIPSELLTRRVEITGPAHSPKMVINMLSRNENGDRADMAMLDFEDSMKPSFSNVVDGYQNVIGAVTGNLMHVTDKKTYRLNPTDMAYVMVRVRGLHLDESNVIIDDMPIAAGILDLVVCFYHTVNLYLTKKQTPKFYIPKCEHYLEARWWNNLFIDLEKALALPLGTLRTTFLIETLPASFQVEEILYEVRDHAVGLNVGRWDKIFSDIKIFRNHSDKIFPDRGTINMERPWMENYAKRVIKICHERGAFAMGGMSACTPGKTKEQREEQTNKVVLDKQKEADWGHDGCWVSHPYFIGAAMKSFKNQNQLTKQLNDFHKFPDILPKGTGPRTLQGLRTNIRVGIAYMHGWSKNVGCISLDNLMEDLATLEISRAQTWQWMSHQIELDDGMKVTKELIKKLFHEEHEKLILEISDCDLIKARDEAFELFTTDELKDFLSFASNKV